MLAPLCLIDGRYDITRATKDQEPIPTTSLALILTLDGLWLWGKFNFGLMEGVLRFEARRWKPSFDDIGFQWRRRRTAEDASIYSGYSIGQMKFLGHGRIEGTLWGEGIEFHAERALGQGAGSDIPADEMKSDWESCS